jgi:hypothetical protein
MEFNFLDRVMVKSKLRRAETFVRGEGSRKQWVISRFARPRGGVVIGWRTLSDGVAEYNGHDEATIYHPKRYFRALLVVISEKQNPIYVLPEEAYERSKGE